ncbi:MAG: lipocalin family protein [Rhodoferax sp.]|nr:lipocalin family protein [Rhodoferax sp.]
MHHLLRWIIPSLLSAAVSLASAQPASAPRPLQSIASLDLARYGGTWYEIAKYPNWFQRQCASDTRAEYSARQDGQVRVLNRCRRQDGSSIEADGVARQVGGAQSSRLQVRFAPDWLAFIPALWADYWVIDLDPGYQLAAVSEPGREYLWILARQPQPPAAELQALLQRLGALGFDLNRLESTRQSP